MKLLVDKKIINKSANEVLLRLDGCKICKWAQEEKQSFFANSSSLKGSFASEVRIQNSAISVSSPTIQQFGRRN